MAKPKAPAAASAKALRELTDQAQKQPGLAQLLSLVREVQESERTVHEMAPESDYAVGGTLGHTYT
jgi:hypothetical protein